MWALGDEDHSRIMTKFDTKSAGLQMIQILLPGTPSIYYGEEIQMKDHPSISYEDTVEPFVKAAGPQNYSRYSQLSRDPYHTPMLWNSSRNAGTIQLYISKRELKHSVLICCIRSIVTTRIYDRSTTLATHLQQWANG